MPILNKPHKRKKNPKGAKIKVLEMSRDILLPPDKDIIADMTIEDFESGSWRKKVQTLDMELDDIEYLNMAFNEFKVREINENDEPAADIIWFRNIEGALKIWKTGPESE